MWSVYYGRGAENDLLEIYDYVAVQLCDPQTAEELFDTITVAVAGLAQMPYRFRLWAEEPWHSMGIRRMVVKNHVVLYLPDEDLERVRILRILYHKRDISRHLAQYIPPGDNNPQDS